MAVFSDGPVTESIINVRINRRDFGQIHFHPGDFFELDVYKEEGRKKYGISFGLPNGDFYSLGGTVSPSKEEVLSKFYGYIRAFAEGRAKVRLDYPEKGLADILEEGHNKL